MRRNEAVVSHVVSPCCHEGALASRTVRTLLCLTLIAAPTIAAADDADDAAPAPPPKDGELVWKAGGYVQSQLRVRQDDPVAAADENGFRVRRARVTAHATRRFGAVELSTELEAELTPDFQLLDAYVSATSCLAHDGRWRVDVGQVKAPVSRQTLLSDSRLGFVDKPELAGLAPDRQLGALATLAVPHLPHLRLAAGLFNGEGRNLGGNVDQHFLYAGRVEFAPFGREVALAESNLGGDYLVIAGSAAQQRRDAGDGLEDETSFGADVAFGWRGASGTVEYLQVRHTPADQARPGYRANGIVAQLAYLIPVARLRRHLEVAARWEEIDRNDTIPIVRRGDPNQSLRYFTGAISWYQHDHALKLQVSASHIVEIEDRDAGGNDASYANDTLLVQATFRIE